MHHGDVYPLPIAPVDPPLRRADVPQRYLYNRLQRRNCRRRRVRHASLVLNWCAEACVRSASCEEGASLSKSSFEPNASQQSVLRRIGRRVGAAGPHPGSSNREAVIELLKIQDLHEQQPSTLESFDWSKLKLLRDDWAVVPKDIVSVAPPAVAAMFHDVSQFRRSEEEMERALADTEPLYPYWDPVLKNDRTLRIRFLKTLAAKGLVPFRRRIFSKAGLFFVWKKGGQIRMVVDGRHTNRSAGVSSCLGGC